MPDAHGNFRGMSVPADASEDSHMGGNDSEPFIPGEEGLTTEPLSTWRIEMGDLTVRVRATEYEHAVVWLEVWCHDQGIERRGASFVRERSAA